MSQTGCLELEKTILHTYLLMKKGRDCLILTTKSLKPGTTDIKPKPTDQPAFMLTDDAAGLTALPVPGM